MPQYKGSTLLYGANREFVDRCLVQDLSLVWPTEPVWTAEHLRQVTERFVDGAFYDDRSFAAKLAEQFASLPPACWKLLAIDEVEDGQPCLRLGGEAAKFSARSGGRSD